MEFIQDEMHQELVDMYRDFAENSVKSLAAEIDKTERFPEETVAAMAEMGLLGIPFPEEYGGTGMDNLSYAQCVEELSKVCASTGVIVSAHTSLCATPIYMFGTEEQKKKYLVPLASGEKLGAFGLTEPGAGTDASGQKTTAVDKGDYWLLNGSKCFITNGGPAEIYVVFAMTDKEAGNHGISAFIVEKGFEGFSIGKHEEKMGIRASATSELIFEDCRVPKENLLGELNKGFKVAMMTLDGGRIGIASQALGIAEGAIAETVKYVKERKQFGEPIINFQMVQQMLADMAIKIEASRCLVNNTMRMMDQGSLVQKEGSITKTFVSDCAQEVTSNAVQIFGGYGYSKEYPVEKLMRDCKVFQIFEGANQVQRMTIANVLKKEYK